MNKLKKFTRAFGLLLMIICVLCMPVILSGCVGNDANAMEGTQGEAGQDGKDGKDGKDGQDGEDGEDGEGGKSAFDLWLETNYATDYAILKGKTVNELLVTDFFDWIVLSVADVMITDEDRMLKEVAIINDLIAILKDIGSSALLTQAINAVEIRIAAWGGEVDLDLYEINMDVLDAEKERVKMLIAVETVEGINIDIAALDAIEDHADLENALVDILRKIYEFEGWNYSDVTVSVIDWTTVESKLAAAGLHTEELNLKILQFWENELDVLIGALSEIDDLESLEVAISVIEEKLSECTDIFGEGFDVNMLELGVQQERLKNLKSIGAVISAIDDLLTPDEINSYTFEAVENIEAFEKSNWKPIYDKILEARVLADAASELPDGYSERLYEIEYTLATKMHEELDNIFGEVASALFPWRYAFKSGLADNPFAVKGLFEELLEDNAQKAYDNIYKLKEYDLFVATNIAFHFMSEDGVFHPFWYLNIFKGAKKIDETTINSINEGEFVVSYDTTYEGTAINWSFDTKTWEVEIDVGGAWATFNFALTLSDFGDNPGANLKSMFKVTSDKAELLNLLNIDIDPSDVVDVPKIAVTSEAVILTAVTVNGTHVFTFWMGGFGPSLY